MTSKKIFFVFALVILYSLSLLTADSGYCSCESSFDSSSSQYVCTTNAILYGSNGNVCPSFSGYNGCSTGYNPKCNNANPPLLGCDSSEYGGLSQCGECTCDSDTYPYGNTCYDFLDTIGLDGGCSQVTNLPAVNISKVDLTEEMDFGEGWNSFLVGIYGDAYCLWEEDNEASRCVACPQGMIWEDSTSRCVCGPPCSEPASCSSNAEEKKCVTNPSGCSVQQSKTCSNGEYCGNSGSCGACPTTAGGGCTSDACYGVDPDCGCIPGNGVCGAGCTYIDDTDCETPHNIECAPLACDGKTKSGCSDIDPDSLCTPTKNDGICCLDSDCTSDLDCNLATTFSYSATGLVTSKEGTNDASYSYNVLDRLIKATYDGKIEQYYYDASGKRVKKINPNELTYYLYQGNDVLFTDEQIFCACPNWQDPNRDGTIVDVLDVVQTVNVAFRGFSSSKDTSCPFAQTDVDASGATDVIDVVKVVNVAFRGLSRTTAFSGNPCDSGVASPFEPIRISITQPLNGATITQDTLVVASLDRSESDVSVKFYVDNNFVYVDSTSPYEYTLKILDVISISGSHTLKADVVRNINSEVVGISPIATFNIPTLGANTVLNPGFESVSGNDILNWDFDTSGNEGSYTVNDAGTCRSGSRCITSSNNNWHPQRNVQLNNNSQYLLSYWTKKGSPSVQSAHISLEDTNSPWDHILSYCTHGFLSGDWEQQTCLFNTNNEIVEQFSIYLHQPGDLSNTPAYYDDVEVREIGSGTGTTSVPPEGENTPVNSVQVKEETQPVATQANTTNSTNLTCTNECSSGQLNCSSSYSQTCGNYDTDSCLEWSTGTFCQYGCTNGICNSTPENGTASCFENDGGNQLYTKGNNLGQYTNGTSFNVSDYCADSYSIREYWCNPNLQLNTYDCRNYGNKICVNGVCIVGNRTKSTLTANVISDDKSVFGGILDFFKKIFRIPVTGEAVITTKEPSVLILKEGAKNSDGTQNIDIYLTAQRPTNGIQFNVIYDPAKVTLEKASTSLNFQLYTYNAGAGNLLIGMFDNGNGDKIEIGTSKILTIKTKSAQVSASMIKGLKNTILTDAEIIESYGPIEVKNTISSSIKPIVKKPGTSSKTTTTKGTAPALS